MKNEKLPISQKWLIVWRNGVKFRTCGVVVTCIWGLSLTFSSSKSHLGVIPCACLKLACNAKKAERRSKRTGNWDSGGNCNMYMDC